MKIRFFLLLAFLTIGKIPSFSQELTNKVFSDNIKTVRLFPSTNEVGLPIIRLNSNEPLKFSFDELGDESKTYYYTLIHCDFDWQATLQDPYEYIDGFTRATIDDYSYSSIAQTQYVHYSLDLPNWDMKIKQSGNYILSVYEDDPQQPIIHQRFMVIEEGVEISKDVTLPKTRSNYRDYQEVIFNVVNNHLNINNPFEEVRASVLQNQRWDNAYQGLRPRFVRNNLMDFDYNGAIVFEAGKEYRRFDIRSLRFLGMGVRSIQFDNVYLLLDPIKKDEKYFIETDYNGQYYIDVLEYNHRNTEADYVNVHFNLPLAQPFLNGKLYVGGMFNNYDATPANQMKWNPETKMYENSLLLKQGFYDYLYYFIPEGTEQKTVLLTEGSNYEAENQYDIFIYYKAFGERYSRIIGYLNFNSRLN